LSYTPAKFCGRQANASRPRRQWFQQKNLPGFFWTRRGE